MQRNQLQRTEQCEYQKKIKIMKKKTTDPSIFWTTLKRKKTKYEHKTLFRSFKKNKNLPTIHSYLSVYQIRQLSS